MSDKYILVGQTPVPCDDLIEWACWMQVDEHCQVRLTQVGVWFVSTVFLGLDFNHYRQITGQGEPLLFETMAWKKVPPYIDALGVKRRREFHDDILKRCATWIEAERQHVEVIAQIAQPGDEMKQIKPEPIEILTTVKGDPPHG